MDESKLEYTIAKSEEISELSETVNNLLEEGWVLHGGPSVTTYHIFETLNRDDLVSYNIFIQALVRRVPKSKQSGGI